MALSRVRLFETPCTVAYQAPLSTRILQAKILEWVAISFSRGSSQPRDRTRVSRIVDRHFTNSAGETPLSSKVWELSSMVYDMGHLFFFMEKSMCWQLWNLSACFPPVELWDSYGLFSFHPLSFLAQAHSVSADKKFSRTLWVSHVCHKNSLYSIRGTSIGLS